MDSNDIINTLDNLNIGNLFAKKSNTNQSLIINSANKPLDFSKFKSEHLANDTQKNNSIWDGLPLDIQNKFRTVQIRDRDLLLEFLLKAECKGLIEIEPLGQGFSLPSDLEGTFKYIPKCTSASIYFNVIACDYNGCRY